MSNVIPARTGDLVPLADRMRFMQLFRAASVALVGVSWLLLPEVRQASAGGLALATGLYVGAAVTSQLIWRLAADRGLSVFAGMLIADTVFIAWIAHLTQSESTPLRYLALL